MSFQAVIPFGGPAGWLFLSRTLETQKAAFATAPAQQRDTEHFRDAFPKMRSPADLLEDRRALSVALGAFGLEGDLNNRAFIRTLLAEGTDSPGALANRLADKRYLAFASEFSPLSMLQAGPARAQQGDALVTKYMDLNFEKSVGASNEDLRLALTLQRQLSEIAQSDGAENTKYYRVLGEPPVRAAFETAFGLPAGFAAIDIDQQVETLKERVSARFGTADLSAFAEPQNTEELIQLFLLRASLPDVSTQNSAARTALQLLAAG